ncbi:MAG: cysteine hydrolase family protein [Mucilaginibacter sp.]
MENTQNTALVVLDMQTSVLSMLPEQDCSAFVSKVGKAITHARGINIPVIYVVVGFRQGAPEVSANNRTFSAAKERFANADMNEFLKVHPALAPKAGEVIVIKRRVSAFAGSDFDVVVRAMGIQHLILTGIATSGAVLSTLREASDKDFRLTVLSDCCTDGDEEVQRVLMTKIFPRQADVLTVDEWAK